MLRHPPVVLGLTLCEDIVPDPATGNVSIIRAFTGLRVDAFPAVAPPFCLFAAMTDALGEADARLSVGLLLDEYQEVYSRENRLVFTDRLQIVYYVMKLFHCPLPDPGIYLFTLPLDGEEITQRSLRVYSEPMS